MKRFAIFAAMMAMIGFAAGANAQSGTLYQQEGGSNDQDPIEVEGAGSKPVGMTNADNWVHQYGNAAWTGVYAGSDGWLTTVDTGDSSIEVEADIEMYATQTVSDQKIYFHIGNIFNASQSDLTAYVNGTLTSNNGQWVGIQFDGEKTLEIVDTAYTGVIQGGMVSDHHTYNTQSESMDVEILLDHGEGWEPFTSYGGGAHGTIANAVWWDLPGDGGTWNYTWRIRLMPEAAQPDGDYYLDPAIVTAPTL